MLPYGEAAEHLRLLEGPGQAQPGPGLGRRVGDVLAHERDPPPGRPQEAAAHPEERALAGTVGSDQSDQLPGRDTDIDAVEGGQAPEAHHHVRGLEDDGIRGLGRGPGDLGIGAVGAHWLTPAGTPASLGPACVSTSWRGRRSPPSWI